MTKVPAGLKVFLQSADMPAMRDLLYRLPRFTADFPVDVIVGEIAVLGICRDISETGMRGEFRHRLPIGTEGLVRLNHPQHVLELRGRVAHHAQAEMAFTFLFKSDLERRNLCDFARAVSLIGASLRTSGLEHRGLGNVPPPDRRFR